MNFLSVDYDFWVPERLEWDWGHGEASIFADVLWQYRAASFLRRGEDYRHRVKVLADCGVTPSRFNGWLKTEKKCRLSPKADVFVAESHATAYLALQGKTNLHITHIDAHHDCGYKDHDPPGELDCGNWIAKLVEENRVKSVQIVYPTWRLDRGCGGDDTDGFRKKMKKWRRQGVDVEIGYGLDHLPSTRIFGGLFFCRSGGWTPPWLDQDFVLLAKLAMCVWNRGTRLTWTDFADIARPWNHADIERQGEQLKRAFAKLDPTLAAGK